jgi:hypothetical protein
MGTPSLHDIPTLLALSLDTRDPAMDVSPRRDCEGQMHARHSDISCIGVGPIMSEQSRARVLHRNRRLAAGRSMDDHLDRIGMGGLLVVDLANHHCAQPLWAGGKAYMETNALNSVLGDRVRVSNGRPPSHRLRKRQGERNKDQRVPRRG